MTQYVIIATLDPLPGANMADTAEIKVISTQAPQAAFLELAAQFERATGHRVAAVFSGTANVTKWLADGENCDLVIMSSPSLDDQIGKGTVEAGSKVDVAKSGTGLAVREGAPKPDIGTTDALKRTLLAAKSIGYSTGPSGVYVASLLQKMGIADAVKGKLKQTPSGVFVGTLIASGEAEIGFQQISELAHHAGVDYVGPLPAEVQYITTFSAGIHTKAKAADAARALVKFITAPTAATAIRKHGLEPG